LAKVQILVTIPTSAVILSVSTCTELGDCRKHLVNPVYPVYL
jgi:hypothetical protein